MKKLIFLGTPVLFVAGAIYLVGFSTILGNGQAIDKVKPANEDITTLAQPKEPLTKAEAVAREIPDGFTKVKARVELAKILLIKDGILRDAELKKLYQIWMYMDPIDAIDHIHTFADLDIKELLYTAALSVWANDNAIAFSAWLNDIEQDDRFDKAISTICEKASVSENLAVFWATKIVDLGLSEDTITKVLNRWIERDPDEAVQWAIFAPPHFEFMRQIFQILAATNPEQAFISLNLLHGQNNDLIHEALAAMVNFIDVKKMNADALFALQSISDANLRKMAMDVLMPVLGFSDNPLEIAQMLNSLPDNSARNIMQSNLVAIWGQKDPTAAGNFALTLAKGPDRQSLALRSVIDSWQEQDMVAASEWLSTVTTEGDTDLAALSFTINAAGYPEHLSIATDWIERIKDPELKQVGIQNTVAYWYNHDEDAASQYLRDSGIFDEAKIAWFLKDLEDNKNAFEEDRREAMRNNDQ